MINGDIKTVNMLLSYTDNNIIVLIKQKTVDGYTCFDVYIYNIIIIFLLFLPLLLLLLIIIIIVVLYIIKLLLYIYIL